MKAMTIVGDRVCIDPEKAANQTASGLFLPDTGRHDSSTRGVVLALGDGPVSPKGVRLPHIVAVGDRVLFPADAGEYLEFEQAIYVVMREDDILAVIEED